MKTLKELNEKAWYRLLKVLYVFLYIPCLLVLFGAYEAGRDYHQPVYPKKILEALNDPEFYKVDDYDKRHALSEIDRDFKNLDYSEQNRFIENINKIDIKHKKFNKQEITIDFTPIPSNDNPYSDLDAVPAPDNDIVPQSDLPTELQEKWVDTPLIGYRNTFFTVGDRKTPLPQKVVEQKYIYAPYYTRNIRKTILYLLMAMLCYALFMEIIRRTFYYVVVGKLFPKE